jgi:hypothetical protein
MAGLRSKKELRTLPIWQLTLSEYSWIYPDGLASEHYAAVKSALKDGEPVDPKILATYPSLAKGSRK